jgi:nucleotidyltransferase substrate binding protein (TIGR01987 family)
MAQNERIRKNFEQFEKAVKSLNEALEQYGKPTVANDPVLKKTVIAGCIQSFEFTFEILWKLLKHIADEEGISVNSPKSAFKAAYTLELINEAEEETLYQILLKRNLTVHTYNEEVANEIFNFIRDKAFVVINKIKNSIENKLR